MPRGKTIEEKLRNYKVDANGCWVWQGWLDKHGYGNCNHHRKGMKAHRRSYVFHVGPIPEGLVLDHLCRNPSCINPAHLEPVTQKINTQRGIAPSILLWKAGICGAGHKQTPANTLKSDRGYTRCKACHHEWRKLHGEPRECERCGTEFISKKKDPKRGWTRFCSTKCSAIARCGGAVGKRT